MLPEIESLLIVQDRDQKIASLNKELAQIPKQKEKIQEKLRSDTEAVAQAKLAMQQNEVEIKKIELDIATRRDTIGKLKVQQFETKKNEEYTALGEEVVRYTEMVDGLETSELELMEKADELKSALATAQDALAKTQAMVDEEVQELDSRATERGAQLAEVKGERESLVAKVDSSMLALYERLLKSKGVDAVAAAKGAKCEGCHMKLIKSTVVKLQAEKEVTQCENCGRILYSV